MASDYLYHRRRAQVDGQKPGYVKLFLSPRSEFTTLQPHDTVVNPEDAVTISADHAFGVGDGFAELYVLPRQNTAAAEIFGEEGAMNALYKPKFFIPGDSAKTLALVQGILNEELIVLQQDPNTANGYIQYGDNLLPAHVTAASFKADAVYDGVKGYEFELISASKYFYTGTITTRT